MLWSTAKVKARETYCLISVVYSSTFLIAPVFFLTLSTTNCFYSSGSDEIPLTMPFHSLAVPLYRISDERSSERTSRTLKKMSSVFMNDLVMSFSSLPPEHGRKISEILKNFGEVFIEQTRTRRRSLLATTYKADIYFCP